jgi:LAS superfamily LD-carboxypeptidase LdcB
MQVPINFNSDYATRGNDDVCPVVLPGMGINGADIPIGSEDAYRLTSSLPTNFRPTDLVLLPNQYCHYGNPLYLRREAAASLCQMIAAAGQQGYKIRVVSAFRDYSHQMRLYTRAVARGGEDQKSVARPGRSEHFLGTTVDLTNDEAHALKRSFGDTPEGKWLAANAASYGWKMTVMSSNARRSHNDEPWHLRYLGNTINNPGGISPVAQQSSQPQRRDVFGSIGRFLGLRR